jgi:hypothetical protein|tara:strand:+ start:699 stop:1193 length:495 start_codon:yes stop_codon:yes gene_type:complete
MTDISNNFYQLNPANSSGDYLSLKKSKNIYDINNSKVKINAKKIVKRGNRSFNQRMLFNKGLFQNTVCTRGVLSVGTMTSALVLQTGSSTVNDYYKNKLITVTTGAAATESKKITGYTGSTRTITVDTAFTTTTTNASVYKITVDGSTFPYSRVEVDVDNKMEF